MQVSSVALGADIEIVDRKQAIGWNTAMVWGWIVLELLNVAAAPALPVRKRAAAKAGWAP